MVLTCGDGESPGEMMRLIAVGCNRVVLSAVVTGVCPSEISERNGRARIEHPEQPGEAVHCVHRGGLPARTDGSGDKVLVGGRLPTSELPSRRRLWPQGAERPGVAVGAAAAGENRVVRSGPVQLPLL